MRDLRRLDKGFATLNGQRVFVPWFGTPRIVPSAADEIAVVKRRYRAHVVMAIVFIPSLMLGLWSGDPLGFSGVAAALSLVFGGGALFEHRRVRTWPAGAWGYFANSQFMIGYYRALPLAHRLNVLGWSVGLCLLFWPVLLISVGLTTAEYGSWMILLRFAILVLGPGLLFLFFLRTALVALFSLLPLHLVRRAEL